MNWTEVNPDKLPMEEVLAVSETKDFLIGWLYYTERAGFYCSSESEELDGITHYITTADLWKNLKDNKA